MDQMHEGNVGKYSMGHITEEDVAKRLKGVKNKPSFGDCYQDGSQGHYQNYSQGP